MKTADIVRTLITGALLLGFLMIFAQEVHSIWGAKTPPVNEARTYFWTAISVLIGTVTAFLLGVEFPKNAKLLGLSPDFWRGAYAVIYTVAGLIALVTWYTKTEWTSLLVKNLATTFLGIAVPVVSGWLIAPPPGMTGQAQATDMNDGWAATSTATHLAVTDHPFRLLLLWRRWSPTSRRRSAPLSSCICERCLPQATPSDSIAFG